MYKYIALITLLCVGTLATAWLLTKPRIQEITTTVEAPPEISPTPVAFVSSETNDSVFVTFGTSTALLNGLGYSNVLLSQIESASGAKYESQSENLSLWNQGDEITIQRGRKVLFVGVNNESVPLPATEATSTIATTTTQSIRAGSWVWIETNRAGTVIVPKQAGAFTITLGDGIVQGTTDCNTFSGSYQEKDGVLTIGALAMTKKFCEGSEEMLFTQLFIGDLTPTTEGSDLILVHSDGTQSRFSPR